MKATLEFDLNDIDDKLAHLRAVKALDLALVIHNLDNDLRSIEKYNSPITINRQYLREVCLNHNIDIDELLQ